MIPVALPSLQFLAVLTVSFYAGVLLLGWLAGLAVSSWARRKFRQYRKTSIGVMAGLAILSSFYVWVQYTFWAIGREIDAEQAALRITLTEPATLGRIGMPAGTALVLKLKDQRESFTEAVFPQPVSIFGVQADRINRFISIEYDPDTYATLGTYATSVELLGKGSQDVQGWHCDATQPIRFDVEHDGGSGQFQTCLLGEGNTVGDLRVPAGSELLSSNGTVYGDGHVDADRWRIDIKKEAATKVSGLLLREPTLRLGADRQLMSVASATLACETQLGGMRYPVGTLVQSAGRGLRDAYPGALVFSPDDGAAAHSTEHGDVQDGMSVVQMPDGKVMAIWPNEKAGVYRFAKFVMQGQDDAAPAKASCP
ncbi:hypothetical protein RAS12_14950 [Achromobacter seleniivolatilans]|uniref:Uncharacterized protein n=1 Tax=Achromobacter seleniivolatilans TaxID=3047478 RepID=A0ABY9MCU0_9BURK|nr:hypothetical protein [Achromobacter sp. R39]WMD23612.1 hypothetical protein RAS12_14950 [Achromobacter sp. R39]